MTPGEMIAKMLNSDKNITDEDIEKVTIDYFQNAGIDCDCTVSSNTEVIEDIK
jgi:uncharacterized Fe-S center protein